MLLQKFRSPIVFMRQKDNESVLDIFMLRLRTEYGGVADGVRKGTRQAKRHGIPDRVCAVGLLGCVCKVRSRQVLFVQFLSQLFAPW